MHKSSLLGMLSLFSVLNVLAQRQESPLVVEVNASKMNVLYIGVDNIVDIKLNPAGEDYAVEISSGSIKKREDGLYVVRVDQPGEVQISVKIERISSTQTTRKNFRAKRIPDPIVVLGSQFACSDSISTAAFKAQLGLSSRLSNFDFDAKCDILGFKLSYITTSHISGEQMVSSVKNNGYRFEQATLDLINQGEPGDVYIFSEIKLSCPGDPVPRKINGLTFVLK